MLTVLISLAMVFSALAVISMATQPAYAVVTTSLTSLDPAVFGESSTGILTPTVAEIGTGVVGSLYGAGSTVYFYLSTSSSSTGIIGSYVGSYTLPAGDTALPTGATFELFSGSVAASAGSYYILSSNSANPTAAGATFPEYVAITVVSVQPTVVLNSPASQPITTTYGSTVTVTGGGWNSGATVAVTLSYAGGTALTSALTADPSGAISGTFTVPALSGTVSSSGASLAPAYTVVAQQTTSGTLQYMTADASMNIAPSIVVSTESISGAALSSTFNIAGNGFVSGQAIAAFPTGSSGTSPITVQSGSGFVNAYYSTGATVSSTGTFSITSVNIPVQIVSENNVAGQEVQISATGPAVTNTFSDVLYISTPGVHPALYLSPTTGSPGDNLYVVLTGFTASDASVSVLFDGVTLAVYQSSSSGTAGTDANGFAVSHSTLTVPDVQSGVYTVLALDGTYSATATFTVASTTVSITDGSGSPLNGEYALGSSVAAKLSVSADTAEISIYGLPAYEPVTVSDTGQASKHLGHPTLGYGSKGSYTANGLGEFELTYTINYPASTATGTAFTITVTSSVSATATYYAVGLASISLSATSYTPSGTVTATVSGLIPNGASTAPEASGFVGPFAFSLAGSTSPTVLTSGHTSFPSSASGTATESFSLSSHATGVFTLAVVPYASTLVLSETLGTNYELIVSSPSTSGFGLVNGALSTTAGGSGTALSPYTGYPALTAADDNGYGFQVDFYNLQASGPVTVTVYGATGTIVETMPTSVSIDANGAGTVFIPFPAAVGGHDFEISFAQTVGSTATTITFSATSTNGFFYEDTAAVSYEPSSFAAAGGTPATDYSSYFGADAMSGSNVTIYANSLLPNTEYDVFLSTASGIFASGDYMVSFQTGAGGDLTSGVVVPLSSTQPSGTYYLDVAPSSQAQSGSTSLVLTLEVTQQISAFPGELVSTNLPITPPITPGVTYQYYLVYLELNSTPFETIQLPYSSSATSLPVSFSMPNNLSAGNYFTFSWKAIPVGQENVPVTLSATISGTVTTTTFSVTANAVTPETDTVTFTGPTGFIAPTAVAITAGTDTTVSNTAITGYSVTTGGAVTVDVSFDVVSTTTTATVDTPATVTYTYTTPVPSTYYGTSISETLGTITLAQGNGALLTGISSGQIATITADVTNAVTTSMKVPLQELNASVVAINGAVAKIDTAFGNMTATLSAINATVQSISSGQVLVLTKLGSVETSLASLNASLMMVSGNVATINTTLGMVQTSLSSINMTVSSTATSVSGLVGSTATIKTDLGNISGQVTGVSNGVATIQTSIGKLNSTVSQIQLSAGQIKSGSNTLEIFLVVAIVLILITLVIAFLAVNNTNRLAKKFEEQKKQ